MNDASGKPALHCVPLMLEITIASRTDVGARTYNEDCVVHGHSGKGCYAVLSDGAGGHSNGAVASDMVARTAAHELISRSTSSDLESSALHDIIMSANEALNAVQQGLKGRQRMHATVVLLWIDQPPRQALWTHLGDSRLYVLRQGRVDHVTRDDSVVQSMVDAGLIEAEQARHHPNRNQLIAALGSEDPTRPPDVGRRTLRDGDAFLLCSDGWHDRLEVSDIEYTFSSATSVDGWLDAMQARVRERQAVNQDNFSAIAVWVGNPAEVTRVGPL